LKNQFKTHGFAKISKMQRFLELRLPNIRKNVFGFNKHFPKIIN